MPTTDPLKELECQLAQSTDPEAKRAALADIERTIASLKEIGERLKAVDSPMASPIEAADSSVENPLTEDLNSISIDPPLTEQEIDTQLSALLQPYNTTVEDLLPFGDPLPKNHMDAAVYKDSLCLLESQLAKTNALIHSARTDLDAKRRALDKQLRLRETGAAVFGNLLHPSELAQHTQPVTAAEATLRHLEQTMAQHLRQLWHYTNTVRPIDAAWFRARFVVLVGAKLAFMVKERKAEAEALLAKAM